MIAFWTPGPLELVIIGIVALTIFGRKLPDMVKTLTKTLTEYKRGMSDYRKERDEHSKRDA